MDVFVFLSIRKASGSGLPFCPGPWVADGQASNMSVVLIPAVEINTVYKWTEKSDNQ